MAESLNPKKARRAAAHPDRPGEKCRATPGAFVPVVDRNRCEGKRDCVEVCPYNVFEVRRIDDADFAQLSLLGKLKSVAHRRLTVYTPHADACQACGLCVVACPEDALTLRPAPAAARLSRSSLQSGENRPPGRPGRSVGADREAPPPASRARPSAGQGTPASGPGRKTWKPTGGGWRKVLIRLLL